MARTRFIDIVEQIINAAGLMEPFKREGNNFSVRIHNKPFMDLVIESWDAPDGDGRRVCVGHYYMQNGDRMVDSEAVVDENGWLYEFTNAFQRWMKVTWTQEDGRKVYIPSLKREIDSFLVMWARNMKDQGYVDAAKKKANVEYHGNEVETC